MSKIIQEYIQIYNTRKRDDTRDLPSEFSGVEGHRDPNLPRTYEEAHQRVTDLSQNFTELLMNLYPSYKPGHVEYYDPETKPFSGQKDEVEHISI